MPKLLSLLRDVIEVGGRLAGPSNFSTPGYGVFLVYFCIDFLIIWIEGRGVAVDGDVRQVAGSRVAGDYFYYL